MYTWSLCGFAAPALNAAYLFVPIFLIPFFNSTFLCYCTFLCYSFVFLYFFWSSFSLMLSVPLFTHHSPLSSLFFCKINFCPSFLLPSPLVCGCWCASCPSVLAVHLLCSWPCFCSCLFLPLLLIASPLTSFPPIRAWISPLPILLSLYPVLTLGHLLPTLVLGPLGRWVWTDEEDVVAGSSATDLWWQQNNRIFWTGKIMAVKICFPAINPHICDYTMNTH